MLLSMAETRSRKAYIVYYTCTNWRCCAKFLVETKECFLRQYFSHLLHNLISNASQHPQSFEKITATQQCPVQLPDHSPIFQSVSKSFWHVYLFLTLLFYQRGFYFCQTSVQHPRASSTAPPAARRSWHHLQPFGHSDFLSSPLRKLEVKFWQVRFSFCMRFWGKCLSKNIFHLFVDPRRTTLVHMDSRI